MSNSEDRTGPAEDSTADAPPASSAADVESPALDESENEAAEAAEEEFISGDVASPDLAADLEPAPPVSDEAPATPEPVAVTPDLPAPTPEPPAEHIPLAAAHTVEPDRRRRREKREGDSWVELIKTVVYAVIIAVFVRTILFQPFNIPSASMENTLLIGDYLFVSKYSYGYTLYSLPWGYWLQRRFHLQGRLLGSDPNRGDIVVFKFPTHPDQPELPDDEVDYIKRLVGLPGDRIQVKEGILYINDVAVPRERLDSYPEIDKWNNRMTVTRYRETMPNGVSYVVLDRGYSPADNTQVFTVPAGHYFMMGDNRDDSNDSRADVGYVPYENLIGRARFIWFSIDSTASWLEPWTWFSAIRYDRIATVVD